MVRLYIDNVLVITKDEFKYHLNVLMKFLLLVMESVLKVNAENPLFGLTETEYLGFWVSRDGAIPPVSKV